MRPVTKCNCFHHFFYLTFEEKGRARRYEESKSKTMKFRKFIMRDMKVGVGDHKKIHEKRKRASNKEMTKM